MRTLVLALIALFAFGCIEPQVSEELPPDLHIIYSYGACHAEWGRTVIEIDAEGRGTYESGIGNGDAGEGPGVVSETRLFRLDRTELLSLLNGMERSGFFYLEDRYANPLIVDGNCNYISVTRNGTEKMVSISNTKPPEAYSKAAALISDAASG